MTLFIRGGGEWQHEHTNALKHHSEMTPQNITVTSKCYWCSCGAGGPSHGNISVNPSQQAEMFLFSLSARGGRQASCSFCGQKLMFNTLEMAC